MREASVKIYCVIKSFLLEFFFPDYLRCSLDNIAKASFGGQCIGASSNQGSCGLVVDGVTSNQWEGNGGVGQWIKIKFIREYLINTIRVMQKAEASNQIKGLRLEFSEGSEAFVSNKNL